MRGRLRGLSNGINGEQLLTIAIGGDFTEKYDKLKAQDVSIEIAEFTGRFKPSLLGYAWSLIGKISAAVHSDRSSVYEQMLGRYGAAETITDESGREHDVVFCIRPEIPPNRVATHTYFIGRRNTRGTDYACYVAIKSASEYGPKELSTFVSGLESECVEMGLELKQPHRNQEWRRETLK